VAEQQLTSTTAQRDLVATIELAIAGRVVAGTLPITAVLAMVELDELRSPHATAILRAAVETAEALEHVGAAPVLRRLRALVDDAPAALARAARARTALAAVDVDVLLVATMSASGARVALRQVIEQRDAASPERGVQR
jgi:hypothetical protein